MMNEDHLQDMYVSPSVDVFIIQNEGLLCMSGSGSNDPLYEDDEWAGLLDRS